MAQKIGEIFVSLGLSTTSFTKGLNDMKKVSFNTARELERSLAIIGKRLVGAGIAAATGLALLTRRAIDNADHMRDLAKQAGTSVEVFSGLAHAAEQSGLSQEDFAGSLNKLSRAMGEGARGGKEQVAAFARVGISQKELASGSVSLEGALGKIATG